MHRNELKLQAEVLRLGLLLGVRSISDVSDWADERVGSLDSPPMELINISSPASSVMVEVASALRKIPGMASPTEVYSELCSMLHNALLTYELNPRDLARSLRQLHALDELPTGFGEQAACFEEAFYLADSGHVTIDEATSELTNHLAQAAGMQD